MKRVLICLVFLHSHSLSFSQYCIPDFSFTPCGCCDSNGGDIIDHFWTTGGLTDITNMSTGCNGGAMQEYTYYSGMTLSQMQGGSFAIHVQSGAAHSQGFRVWIDFNNDFDFDDPGEDVWESGNVGNAIFISPSIMIPSSASPGLKRMRVMSHANMIPLVTSSCIPTSTHGECEDYDLMVLSPAACSGQPIAGNTVSSMSNPCLGQSFTLSLSGVPNSGLLYQWITSTNSISWTNIPGATSASYYVSGITSNHCYRCIVTCAASSLTDTSTSLCINPGTFSPLTQCYCPATHTGGSTNCITNVSLSNISNTTGGCTGGIGNYNMYGSPVANLITGQQFVLSVSTSMPSITSVWIDFDHSASFSPSEWYQLDMNSILGIDTLTIPLTAMPGLTRMRIRSNQVGNPNGAGAACDTMSFGETEDYIVSIGYSVPTILPFSETGSFSVFPNPANHLLMVEGMSGIKKELFNGLGQKVLESTLNTLDVSILPKGIYYLRCGEYGNKVFIGW